MNPNETQHLKPVGDEPALASTPAVSSHLMCLISSSADMTWATPQE
jgi:hypothetical protein